MARANSQTLTDQRETDRGTASDTPTPRARKRAAAQSDAQTPLGDTANHAIAKVETAAQPAAKPKRTTRAPASPGQSGSRYETAKLPTLTSAHTRVTGPQPAVKDEAAAKTRGKDSSGARQPRISKDDTSTSAQTPKRTSASAARRRETAVLPALHALSGPVEVPATEDNEAPVARHSVTTARPLTSGDTALIEEATQALRAVELVKWDAAALTPVDEALPREPVTVITGSLKADPWTAPRPKQHPVRVAIRWGSTHLLAVIAILVTISAATPLIAAHVAQHAPALALAQLGTHANTMPQGPWDTSVGITETLGLGGGAAPGVKAPGSAGLAVKSPPPVSVNTVTVSPTNVSPAPFQPWPPSDPFMAVPGHGSFAMNDPNGYYSWAFGQCTWWAQYKRQDENLTQMGNAQYWASGAAARGYSVGSTPIAGSTVVFQPGVQGAGGAGHVAHVEAVYPDGWFLISEMNFYVNGGGWGRVDYRYAHTGWGVQFIA